MDYTTYSTDDFLADESFQSYVAGDNPAAVQFWRAWLKQHPVKEPEFSEAVEFLTFLTHRRPPALPEGLQQAEAARLPPTP